MQAMPASFIHQGPSHSLLLKWLIQKLGETILDPACGTGGFLTNSIEYIRTHSKVKNTA
jgi:type I restriction-modification system DNA methylase subunit